ncbi:MAG: hypothetical protein IBX69_01370 [Anaerolineales bacterium]|nr:hypothetical protein [Anaerolineales bacterium]
MDTFIFTALNTYLRLQDTIDPNLVESTSSNPGLVIGSAVLVAIVIGGVILHSFSPKKD